MTCLKIAAVDSEAAVCKLPGILSVSNASAKLLGIVPRASAMMGTGCGLCLDTVACILTFCRIGPPKSSVWDQFRKKYFRR